MMKVGLIADIHADVRALETALRNLDRLGAEQILCAGDLVGYGAQPDDTIALLRDRSIPCIRGNHDRWALERRQVIGPTGWKPAAFRDETWEFLAALPASRTWIVGDRSVAIHHGSPSSDMEFVSPYKALPPSIVRFWQISDAKVLILGHTHLPMIDRGSGGTIINPGSILGVPGVPTSYSFAIVDGNGLAVRIHEVRTGRELRRDPIFLEEAP